MWGVANASVNFAVNAGPQTSIVQALRDVSIAAPRGTIRSIVGGDGAGKTTLLNVLIGRVIPAAGTVNAPDSRLIGFMPSTSGVWRELSVEENVTFVGRAYGMSTREITQRRDELLERAGLRDTLGRLGGQLSGGMRQKLGFCLALLHQPELIVLDEPSTGVDPVSRIELWRLITEVAAQGMTVIMTSTYLDEAERAEQVLVLEDGVTLYSGPPQDVALAIPGTIRERDANSQEIPPSGSDDGSTERSWRRGQFVRTWYPPSEAAPSTTPTQGTEPANQNETETAVTPDLEDAVIALTLAHRFSTGVEDASPVPPHPAEHSSHPPQQTGPHTDQLDPDAEQHNTFTIRSAAKHRAIPLDRIVDMRGVTKRFGDFTALDDASLTVEPGEVVGLLGANGAGKTTLIRILLGLERTDGGLVDIFGASPSRASRRRLGYMPQGLGLYEELSVRQNVNFVVGAFGVRNPIALPHRLRRIADRPVGSIGLGLQRQLAFHCALVHEPELLVLDEPTSGVDPLARARLWDTIRGQAESGTGVLVTTHYMQEAEQCDRLILLAHGAVIASGREQEIIGEMRTTVVGGGAWQQSFEQLSAAGLIVTLAGTQVRVVGASAQKISDVLEHAGLTDLTMTEVAATLEERLAVAG